MVFEPQASYQKNFIPYLGCTPDLTGEPEGGGATDNLA